MTPSISSNRPAHGPAKLDEETVLVMQGGGSLGAYECGVYKSLVKHEIRFDMVAGTSIGAINAAIIASNDDVQILEDFWLDLAETLTPSFLPDSVRSVLSSTYSAMYGNPKAFLPKWWSMLGAGYTFSYNLPYLYEIEPLKKTLTKYVNFARLTPEPGNGAPRLILTCTDLQKGEPVVFDSKHTNIDVDHVAACTGFPFYGIAWTHKDGRYLWDGSLLNNTPLREAINASPILDKIVYIVNLFPHVQEELPRSMSEAWHRARDILYIDKTDQNVRMSRMMTRHLRLLREMYDVLDRGRFDDNLKTRLHQIRSEYHKLCHERGALIKDIIRIERKEESQFLFEDADFSIATIRKLIKQGEQEADAILAKRAGSKENELRP